MFCNQCGTALDKDARFCHNCGAVAAPPGEAIIQGDTAQAAAAPPFELAAPTTEEPEEPAASSAEPAQPASPATEPAAAAAPPAPEPVAPSTPTAEPAAPTTPTTEPAQASAASPFVGRPWRAPSGALFGLFMVLVLIAAAAATIFIFFRDYLPPAAPVAGKWTGTAGGGMPLSVDISPSTASLGNGVPQNLAAGVEGTVTLGGVSAPTSGRIIGHHIALTATIADMQSAQNVELTIEGSVQGDAIEGRLVQGGGTTKPPAVLSLRLSRGEAAVQAAAQPVSPKPATAKTDAGVANRYVAAISDGHLSSGFTMQGPAVLTGKSVVLQPGEAITYHFVTPPGKGFVVAYGVPKDGLIGSGALMVTLDRQPSSSVAPDPSMAGERATATTQLWSNRAGPGAHAITLTAVAQPVAVYGLWFSLPPKPIGAATPRVEPVVTTAPTPRIAPATPQPVATEQPTATPPAVTPRPTLRPTPRKTPPPTATPSPTPATASPASAAGAQFVPFSEPDASQTPGSRANPFPVYQGWKGAGYYWWVHRGFESAQPVESRAELHSLTSTLRSQGP